MRAQVFAFADKDAVADCGEEFVQRIADERPPVRPVGAGLEAHFIHDRRPYAVEDVAQHQVVVVDAEHGVFDEKGCVHVFKVGFAAVVHSFREERNEGQAFQIAEFRFLGKVIGVVPVDDEQGTRLKKFFHISRETSKHYTKLWKVTQLQSVSWIHLFMSSFRLRKLTLRNLQQLRVNLLRPSRTSSLLYMSSTQ